MNTVNVSRVNQKNDNLRIIPSSEILDVIPTFTWRIKNLFPSTGMAQIHGPSGVGKSFLAFDMACAIAGGDQWFGHRVHQSPVVYATLEGGVSFKLRAKAWEKHYKKPIPEELYFMDQPFSITQTNDVNDFSMEIPHGAVVIIDPMRRATRAYDESSNKDIRLIMGGVIQLSSSIRGLVIMVRKSENNERHTQANQFFKSFLDTSIDVSRSGNSRFCSVDRQRYGNNCIEHTFRLKTYQIGVDEDGDDVTSCAVENIDE